MSNSVAYFIFGSAVHDNKTFLRLEAEHEIGIENDPKAIGFHCTRTSHRDYFWFGSLLHRIQNGFSESFYPQDMPDSIHKEILDARNILPDSVREILRFPGQLTLVFQD